VPARLFPLLAAGALLASGCGPAKLDEKKTVEVDPGGDSIKAYNLPAQPKPQRITVEFESDNPVEVAVYKADDAKALESLPASKALATEKAKTSGTLAVDLGPDVATTVVVTALSKKSSVKLHMTNRK
jgi:hypothetical protein